MTGMLIGPEAIGTLALGLWMNIDVSTGSLFEAVWVLSALIFFSFSISLYCEDVPVFAHILSFFITRGQVCQT